MEKKEILKDGTEILIRPLHLDDIDALMAFYQGLPLEDRKYLKYDVTDRILVTRRLRRMEAGETIRIIALLGGAVIAEGTLDLTGDQWSKHQGEIRVLIARPWQQKGLGTVMIRELYFTAVQMNLEVIVARMMRPQIGAQRIFRRLGFREATLLPDHVRDIEGRIQDLIIMTCDVKVLWKELDQLYSASDWQRCR